jgi:hypothetical protein
MPGEVWSTFTEEGPLPGPYMWFGFAYLNGELLRVALNVAKILERHGYQGQTGCRYLPVKEKKATSSKK